MTGLGMDIGAYVCLIALLEYGVAIHGDNFWHDPIILVGRDPIEEMNKHDIV
jgi:hypothetical protein